MTLVRTEGPGYHFRQLQRSGIHDLYLEACMAEPGRPQTGEFNSYYQKYIDLVPDDDIRMLLRVQLADTLALLRPISEAKAGHRYAEGKWSIKQVVGHLIDAERVFLYRATCIARGDRTPLPSFDENKYVYHGKF